jgi:ABC-type antimicrobial peptide transport system permease subunit
MNAVWMRARNELRSHWRALLSLALIAGLGAGAAVAATAGARRTLDVYPRFREATHAFDDLVGPNSDSSLPGADARQLRELAAIESLPELIDSSLSDAFTCAVTGPSGTTEAFPDLFAIASPDGRLGTTLNEIKILSGRPADPNRVDEVVLTTFEAERLGAKAGSLLTLTFPQRTLVVHVAGIGIMAGAVDPAAGGYTPIVLLTPAFYRAHTQPAERAGPTLAVRVRGGLAGIPAFEKDAARRNQDLNLTIASSPQTAAVRRTAAFQSVGLLLFGGLALLTVLAIFVQLLARQIFLESEETEALRALGMSRKQLFGLAMIRVGLVGAIAAVVTVAIAIAASPIFPIGFMHQLEVSPGVRFDALALLAGAGGTIALILLAGLWPAWRASGAKSIVQREGAGRTNKTANALAGASFPPSAVAGVRMALEPGHGSSAVPVRTTIAGTVLALTALIASLSFGASLQYLVSTPRLSGWDFDVIVPSVAAPGDASGLNKVLATGVVGSYSRGSVGQAIIGGTRMDVFSFQPGSFGPSIVSGRRPSGTTQIALPTKTLRTLHTSVGKTISVDGVDQNGAPLGHPVQLQIVGTVITPQLFFSTSIGNSAVVSQDFVDTLPGVTPGGDTAYIRFKPGVSISQGLSTIRHVLPVRGSFILRRSASSDLTNVQRIAQLPDALAGLLALVAAGTLAHTLISSVRRRRRDLAILRTLGFDRRQVRFTIVWQATTIIVISLAVGLPLGAVAGRWAWRLFVDQLGYVRVSVVPLVAVLLTIPAAILLANIIASIPARTAARMKPAVVLREE